MNHFLQFATVYPPRRVSGRSIRLVRSMRPIIAFLLLASATPMLAQYEMRKTSDGVLIVSNVVGRKYTFDVPGKTIVPYGKNEADHPYLSTDGTFLQILSVPFTQFDADASAGDEAVLRQQMKYEANNYDVPLASIDSHTREVGGRTVLVWSFMPTLGSRPVRQVFLTLRAGSYVVVIGSSVERGQNQSSIESLLARIAGSFHAT